MSPPLFLALTFCCGYTIVSLLFPKKKIPWPPEEIVAARNSVLKSMQSIMAAALALRGRELSTITASEKKVLNEEIRRKIYDMYDGLLEFEPSDSGTPTTSDKEEEASRKGLGDTYSCLLSEEYAAQRTAGVSLFFAAMRRAEEKTGLVQLPLDDVFFFECSGQQLHTVDFLLAALARHIEAEEREIRKMLK